MPVPVRYYCPRCETVVTLQREARLADKSVTPVPLEGWRYVGPEEPFEADDADGVRFVCGETPADSDPDGAAIDRDDAGCGEPFYLDFVRFEDGREVEPTPESEYVRLAEGRGPTGPQGPGRPGEPDGPEWAGDPTDPSRSMPTDTIPADADRHHPGRCRQTHPGCRR